MNKIVIILTIILAIFSTSSFCSEQENSLEKLVTVVVENRKGKELPDDIDAFLASTVGGLETVQKKIEKVGKYDCDCAYMSHGRGSERTSQGEELKWAAYDIRLGKYLSNDFRIDFIYFNEGRPKNNHRDGFALQAVYDLPVSNKLKLELGAGPYFSMSTTSINNNISNQIDDKHLGILSSIAALYSLDQISPGMHLRAEYNQVIMPGTFNTNSILIGVGKDFSTTQPNSFNQTEVALIGDHFKTNHHLTRAADGYQVELKHKVTDNTDLSVSYIREGKDALT